MGRQISVERYNGELSDDSQKKKVAPRAREDEVDSTNNPQPDGITFTMIN